MSKQATQHAVVEGHSEVPLFIVSNWRRTISAAASTRCDGVVAWVPVTGNTVAVGPDGGGDSDVVVLVVLVVGCVES